MINSKCSEKVIKKKKRSPIILVPDVDNKFNYKQRSMNELKQMGDNSQQNNKDDQQSKSTISLNKINKARSSQQKFTNYKHLIQEYEKYKVKKVNNNSNQILTGTDCFNDDNSIYTQTQSYKQKMLINQDDKSLFNKTTFINQRRQKQKQKILHHLNNQIANYNSIKKYSSMKNLLQKISSPYVQMKIKKSKLMKYQHQQDKNDVLCKKQKSYTNQYKNNYQESLETQIKYKEKQPVRMHNKQSMIKKKVHNQQIPNQLVKYYKVKSNNTIKQLQHKYMLLNQKYNKSLKHTKQINQLFEKQKNHLIYIKTQHFQNQQLIDQLMDQVRNRDYLHNLQTNYHQNNQLKAGQQSIKRIRDCSDINIQTQQSQLQQLNAEKYLQSCKNNNLPIKVQQIYNNKKLNNYLQINQSFHSYYQNIKSNVQTYQVFQQQDNNQVYQHSISYQKQNDSHSITELKKDLFNVKNMIHQQLNIIQKSYIQQNTKNIDLKVQQKLKSNDKVRNKVVKPCKYRFQPSISISLQP